MANFIKIMIQLLAFLFCITAIGYFVAFEIDPLNVCRDHSNPKLRKTHFECTPLSLEIEKPIPERKFHHGKF